MSSLEGILASRSQSQESEAEQTTPVICGHSSETSLDLFGQEFVPLKTSGGTFDWDCRKCLATCDLLATELGRVYSQRVKLARLTDENESLSLPTSRAGDGTHGGPNQRDGSGSLHLSSAVQPQWMTPEALNQDGYQVANGKKYPRLGSQAQWPTVTTSEATGGKQSPGKQGGASLRNKVQDWPTATSRDHKGVPPNGYYRDGKLQLDLLDRAVEYWRTPSASDGEGGIGDSPTGGDAEGETSALQTPGSCERAGDRWPARPGERQYEWEEPRTVNCKLNPRWVSQLMGFPSDWCEVEGLTREMKLRGLGNAVVPQQAAFAIRTLCEAEEPEPDLFT